jgi:CubicO group peptidase (beta-lactamase class C family)
MESRSRTIVLAVAAILLPALAPAQRAGVTQLPDSVVAAIDRVFAFTNTNTPGCALGVARGGASVLTRAYGMANLEYDVPNDPETIFESGSVAKQFTAAAVMLLAQEGKLSLDEDVRKHLPEVPDFGETITIRHLLQHTSGLRDQWGLLSITGNPPGRQVHTFATILDLVSRQKALNFAPGTEYLYSNTGYALAAVIVARTSGKSFAQFSEERLFKPLGMSKTRWRDDFAHVVKQRATAYEPAAFGTFRLDMPFTNVHGNGGLLTTVGDLLRWNAFLDAPGADVGGTALVDALQTPGRLRSGKSITYGLGLGVSTANGRRSISHGGSTAGYRTWLVRYPDERVSVALLCNHAGANATGLGSQVAALVLPRRAESAQAGAPMTAPFTVPPEHLERYAGLFQAPSIGIVVRTLVRNGRLVAEQPGNYTLTPVDTHRFRIGPPGDLLYRFNGNRVREILMIAGSDTTTYLPATSPDTSAVALRAYAGSYWSEELEVRLDVAVDSGRVIVKQRPNERLTLRPLYRDAFAAPGAGNIIFTRDRSGKIDGFGVWAGRVRNLRFTKRN